MRRCFYIVLIIIPNTFLFGQLLDIELYEYAEKAPKTNELGKVTSYLKKGAENQKELAELLAYWMMGNIAYDVDGFSSNNYQSSNWDVTFSTKKAVCSGYAELYQEMCNRVNLKCEIISGYAKGFNHIPETTFNRSNHAWNLIEIDSGRFLMDITWASGGVEYQNGKLNFFKFLKPELLFCKPEIFIEEHLPSQRRWQLLNYPVTYENFTKFITYEEMVDSTITYFNFQDSIDYYYQLDTIEKRSKDVQEAYYINSSDLDIPIYYEMIAYELSQNLASRNKLVKARRYYLTAKELYKKSDDRKRCDKGIEYVNFYLKKL